MDRHLFFTRRRVQCTHSSCPRVKLGMGPPIEGAIFTIIVTQCSFDALLRVDPAGLQIVRNDPCRVRAITSRRIFNLVSTPRIVEDVIASSTGSSRTIVLCPCLKITSLLRHRIKVLQLDKIEELQNLAYVCPEMQLHLHRETKLAKKWDYICQNVPQTTLAVYGQ